VFRFQIDVTTDKKDRSKFQEVRNKLLQDENSLPEN